MYNIRTTASTFELRSASSPFSMENLNTEEAKYQNSHFWLLKQSKAKQNKTRQEGNIPGIKDLYKGKQEICPNLGQLFMKLHR